MATKKIKKVFPIVPGTEVTIRFKNKFGNMIAINVNDKGFPIEDNPDMTDDLKIKIMRNIQNGLLVVREVEVTTKKSNEEEVFLNEFEKLLKPKTENKSEAPKSEPKKVESAPKKVESAKEESKSTTSTKKEATTPLTKKK